MPEAQAFQAAPQRPVPTVRAIIVDAAGRVLLLCRRASAHGDGQWCLPGGKVDYEVTVEQALAQELSEEASLSVTRSRFLFYQDSLPLSPGGMHVINFCFECSVTGELKLNDESSRYAWVARSELDRYSIAFRNDEILRRYWSETQP